MDRNEAATLARTLMDQHNLHHVPFVWTRAKRTLGVTKFQVARMAGVTPVSVVKSIGLSTEYVDLLPREEIKDVILHEIAHALAGHEAGHGVAWRNMARKVGAKPARCATPSARPSAAYTGVCPKGHTFDAHRLPQRVKFCPQCPGLYKHRMITWQKDGKALPVTAMPMKFRQEVAHLKVIGRI
jgi:predicted SprT family Zn-dependent metalloprotease